MTKVDEVENIFTELEKVSVVAKEQIQLLKKILNMQEVYLKEQSNIMASEMSMRNFEAFAGKDFIEKAQKIAEEIYKCRINIGMIIEENPLYSDKPI
jgi:hypothetical protein